MTLKDLFGNDLLEDEDDDLQANQVGNPRTAATIKVRDYQIRDIARIDASSCAVYVLPTGGGKTVIFAHLIKQIVERGESVLIIAHRFEIIKKYSKRWSSSASTTASSRPV